MNLNINRGEIWVSHHHRDVDSPDQVAFWTSGHFRLEYVGLCVDGCHFGAVLLEGDLLHRPVLPAQTNMAPGWKPELQQRDENYHLTCGRNQILAMFSNSDSHKTASAFGSRFEEHLKLPQSEFPLLSSECECGEVWRQNKTECVLDLVSCTLSTYLSGCVCLMICCVYCLDLLSDLQTGLIFGHMFLVPDQISRWHQVAFACVLCQSCFVSCVLMCLLPF